MANFFRLEAKKRFFRAAHTVLTHFLPDFPAFFCNLAQSMPPVAGSAIINKVKTTTMANKRQLKKAIANACGQVAGQCIMAQESLGNNEKWDEIIVDVALLQREAIDRVSLSFDRRPKDFATGKEYRAARRNYFKQAEKSLASYMHDSIGQAVDKMNALLPKKQ